MTDTEVKNESELRQKIRKEIENEFLLGSHFVAAFVSALTTALLTYLTGITWLGNYPILWLSIAGLIIGFFLDQRVVFFLLGSLVTVIIMRAFPEFSP